MILRTIRFTCKLQTQLKLKEKSQNTHNFSRTKTDATYNRLDLPVHLCEMNQINRSSIAPRQIILSNKIYIKSDDKDTTFSHSNLIAA